MGTHKRAPKVAEISLGQWLIEIGKDLLIVALTCSAIYLVGQTSMASQLRSWMAPVAESAGVQPRQARESVIPYGIAVRSSLGLYGASYDGDLVERTFAQVSPLLGEALTTAGETESITPRQWRKLLECQGIYCQFQGKVPLGALSAWLGEGGGPEGCAQSLILSHDGSGTWLAWQDGSNLCRSPVRVAYAGHMDRVLEEFNPNGVEFVYTLRESDKTFDSLDPYVLVGMTGQRPMVYAASAPDFKGDREALETLLTSLGFRSGASSAYEAAGELAINESGDRLRVNADGRVVFHAGEEERYSVSSAGETVTVEEAALCAWDVLNRAAGPFKGETAYVLSGAEQTQSGWVIEFQARLGGIPVYTGQEGRCAQFTIEGRRVTDFTLDLRGYTDTGNAGLVTSERLAAAALRSRSGTDGRLLLCYRDNRGSTVSAGWVVGE